MIKEIKYGGFSAVPSDYESPDGDLAVAVNLMPEDGHLKPISQPKVIMQLPDNNQEVMFVHETAAFKHYIIYDKITGNISWLDGLSGNPTSIGNYFGTSHCNAVGNTLLIFTDTAITYMLWQDNSYNVLGNHLPDIQLSFGLVGHPRLYSVSDSDKSTFKITFDGIGATDLYSEFSDDNKTKITEQIMAKLNKFVRQQTIEKGRFCFPFFVRYALRLFDGSLVCHSSPILMNPSTHPAPIVLWEHVSGKDTYKEAECDILMVAANLDYYVLHDGDYYVLDKWKDIVTGIEVFISKPLYTYDQEGKISHLRDRDNFDSKFIGRLHHGQYHRGGAPDFAKERKEDCIIGPIEGTDFLQHYMEWNYSKIYELYFSVDRGYPSSSFNLPEFSDNKLSENIKNCSTFYKLCSITLEEAKQQTDRTMITVEDDYLQSLTSREVMADDYLSRDVLSAESSQVYNSRLNLSGVRRYPFAGFKPESLFAFCDRGPASWQYASEDKKKIIISTPLFSDTTTITVYIRENGKVNAVTTSGYCAYYLSDMRYATSANADAQKNGLRLKMSWGNYLFYPNVNAFKMSIHGSWTDDEGNATWSGGTFVADLRPHEFLNGAFALLDYEIVRKPNYDSSSMPTSISSDPIDCGNKVFTSEVNNPFYFPLSGINSIGTGKILGLATAAKALSQGQFGQFPLYAFTTEGVWAMEVSSSGTYSAKQPITRDVCINPDSITQIDSAVLFSTDRGIMLISGSQTQCISDPLNSGTSFDALSLPEMDEIHSLMGHYSDGCLSIVPFSDFLADCGMVYDYVHQRIVVFSPSHSYAYVYSLKSKLWGMVSSDIVKAVKSYPEALAVDSGGNLVDFSIDSDSDTPASQLLVTRPLKLGAPDILKTIDTVIQRGRFRKGRVRCALYGSRDLFSWHLVWSGKEHFLRAFRGSPYKYFCIVLLCNLGDDESINGCTVQFTPRLTNRPR